MISAAIPHERIKRLNDKRPAAGRFVLYWMQQSQRAEENHALEYAVQKGNAWHLPVVVGFGLTAYYPEANLRHYAFMLEGLRDVRRKLKERKILFVVQRGDPPDVALRLGRDASAIICDRGYLRHQREWRERVAREAGTLVEQVESDVIVPVEEVSDKAEAGARTFRLKIMRLWKEFGQGLKATRPAIPSDALRIQSLDVKDGEAILESLSIDKEVKPVPAFTGGTGAAKAALARFIRNGLAGYEANRSQPHTDNLSKMSPYLHFGQISPSYIARKICESGKGRPEDRKSYLDELIVRRELCFNFVYFNKDYAHFSGLPEWARRTLKEHRSDKRVYRYSIRELEEARTHDPYWNASMNEMKLTGYMHNHMRMYWGKQVLAWSETPEKAFLDALFLNNKYFLDGRDPNSYANIGWIFGLHDRPWPERPVFGKIRSMTAGGLERKVHPRAYVEKVAHLMGKEEKN